MKSRKSKVSLQENGRNAFSYSNLKGLVGKHFDKMSRIISNVVAKDAPPFEVGVGSGTSIKSGRYRNTPLPLLPNIRKAEVKVGEPNLFMKLFGIKQKVNTKVELYEGANKRSNRYLRRCYTRMLKDIGAGYDKDAGKVVFRRNLHEIDRKKLTRKERKRLNFETKRYWHIALMLLIRSKSYRMAVMSKVVGKVDRWYHRDFTVKELFSLNKRYSELVSNN